MSLNTSGGSIKLIALDMDGTLLNNDHHISELNQEAIKLAQSKEIDVVLCTGRTLKGCKPYAEELELTSYLVTGNGSEIWDSSGELVERTTLKSELVEMLWDLKQKHSIHNWAASVDSEWKNEMPEDIIEREWLKFGFDIEDHEVRKTLFHLLSDHEELEVSNSSLTNIEVNAAGVNKAAALAKLCGIRGYHMENVLAVGDSLNDMAMIKEAGTGVAMGNAQPAVKDAADWVTTDNNDSGVAAAIKRFI